MKNGMLFSIVLFAALIVFASGCTEREKITGISQLDGKEFAVPTGTIADQLVSSRFPDAKFHYYNTVLDACLAVKAGKADAAAYDEPILRNIAAKNSGMKVLSEMITEDKYGFAVKPGNNELKSVLDSLLQELEISGYYEEMLNRWLPEKGSPAAMPEITSEGKNGVLRFGTSSVTEPFSFVDHSHEVVGLDIEIASLLAKRLGKKLEIVNMEFGAMIPALLADKVDVIGACITISEERAKNVLFSIPYYNGGIAALVKE